MDNSGDVIERITPGRHVEGGTINAWPRGSGEFDETRQTIFRLNIEPEKEITYSLWYPAPSVNVVLQTIIEKTQLNEPGKRHCLYD